MAKGEAPAAPTMPKEEPIASIRWPAPEKSKEGGIRLSGDHTALAMGKRARIVLEGVVRGFSMSDWSCSIDLRVKTLHVSDVGDATKCDEGGDQAMTDMVKGMRGGKKGAKGGGY